jgi:hypothetical protein
MNSMSSPAMHGVPTPSRGSNQPRRHERARGDVHRRLDVLHPEERVGRIVQDDAAAGDADRMLLEHLDEGAQIVRSRIAVIVGEDQQPARRVGDADVARPAEPGDRRVHAADGERRRGGELRHHRRGRILRGVVHQHELPAASRRLERGDVLEELGQTRRPVARADDERDGHARWGFRAMTT